MMAEVLEALRILPNGVYADGTLGGGGHATAILEASAPDGRLFGCDRDPAAVVAATARLAAFPGRWEVRQGNFTDLATWVPAGSLSGAILDLGVSSYQLDEAERGFGIKHDGPLDMRMDVSQGVTAADLVNQSEAEELARMFFELGGERAARPLARAMVRRRQERPFERTADLAGLVERICPRHGRKTHPATKVFQALRIAVNDELGALERGLAGMVSLLQPAGRLVVITFHGLEDRLIKAFGRERTRDYEVEGEVDVPELRVPRVPELRWVTRKALKPGPAELEANPRSRSAQMRVLEKL